MNIFKEIFLSIFETIIPRQCIFCGNNLNLNEKYFCSKCKTQYKYPDISTKDDFFMALMPHAKNICIMSWYEISKTAISNFKFNENLHDGRILCKLLNDRLEEKDWINDIDCIVPVPLSKKKLRQRGFNQCDIIAKQISKRFNIKVCKNNLIKIKNTKEQHKSKAQDRYLNILGTFKVKDNKLFDDKNILLVDDVITTGSTLIECCKTIHSVSPTAKIHIAALSSNRQYI